MDALECILKRRSIRRFRPEKLPRELAEQIIGYTRFSPSWANTKTARYFFVEDDETRLRIAACCTDHNRAIVEGAPNLFVLTGVTGRSGIERDGSTPYVTHTPSEWLMFDSGLATQTLCLAAEALGVGTLIMGGYDLTAIAAQLPIPEDEVLIAVIAAGYPGETPVAPRRKEVGELLRVL